MARIVLGSYLVRFPIGGYVSWVLQWLLGFHRLGHEVSLVEKAGWPDACFDPTTGTMGDDCRTGAAIVDALFNRWAFEGRWCFVDIGQRYHGLSRGAVEELLGAADLYIDMGAHGAWADETTRAGARILVDGEPGATQMRMARKSLAGEPLPEYDFRYTVGRNIGTPLSSAPSGGVPWRPIVFPVNTDLYAVEPSRPDDPFTTIMSWQAYAPIEFDGVLYGQKDVEFAKFIDLPRMVDAPLEAAIAGKSVPREALLAAGWRLRDAHQQSRTLRDFNDYIRRSRGEFSVCKNVFVATNSGWFSDRSAVYLASGRPVVLEETGFSQHLPCGAGLFAVRSPQEAAAAIREIQADYDRHSRRARELAVQHLDARSVLGGLLTELGLS